MADRSTEARLKQLEDMVGNIASGRIARPISSLSANSLFVRSKTLDHRHLKNRTRSVIAPLFSATIRTGTPAITVSGSNTLYRAWAFDAASTEEILFDVIMPRDLLISLKTTVAITPAFWVTNLGAGSGNVVWQVTLFDFWGSGDLNASGLMTTINETQGAAAQDSVSRRAFSTNLNLAVANGGTPPPFIRIGLARLGGDASDTLGNDAGVVGFEFTYTADM